MTAAIPGRALQELRRALASDADSPPGLESSERALYRLGKIHAPLFFGFVLFGIETGQSEGAGRIYYFTREGEFLKKIHDAIGNAQPKNFRNPLPGSELIEISRIASFLPSLAQLGPAEFMDLLRQYPSQSPRSFLLSLGADPEPFAGLVEKYQLGLDETIPDASRNQKLLALLGSADFTERLGRIRDEKRARLCEYLAARGITPDLERMWLVEPGWRGTIQDNLARLFPRMRIGGAYLLLHPFLNPQPPNAVKRTYGPDLNAAAGRGPLWARMVQPLEMIMNSAGGSVADYQSIEGRIAAVRTADPGEDRVYEQFTRHFQAGVLDAIPQVADWAARHGATAAALRPAALALLARLIEIPPPALAAAYFQLNHNDTFGRGAFRNIGETFREEHHWAVLLSPGKMKAMLRVAEASQWPQAFLVTQSLGFLCRPYNRIKSMTDGGKGPKGPK